MSYVPRVPTRVVLPLLGLAVPPMRGLTENLYVFYVPYVVDHAAHASAFGDDATPLREAISRAVVWARGHAGQAGVAPPAHAPASAWVE